MTFDRTRELTSGHSNGGYIIKNLEVYFIGSLNETLLDQPSRLLS